MIKVRKIRKAYRAKRNDPDAWLTKNFEKVIDEYGSGSRYIIIAGNKGIVYTDKDGSPREIAIKAKAKYPQEELLFFRVPTPEALTSICVLAVP